MDFNIYNSRLPLSGLGIFVFFGNTHHTLESLSGSGVNWQFGYMPVCQRGMRLIGTNASGTGFILNYELEPISGALTLPESWHSVTATYYNYSGAAAFQLDPGSWLPDIRTPSQQEDIWGGSHAVVPNVIPAGVKFTVIRTTANDTIIGLIAPLIIKACWFLLMDPASGLAYEGNVISQRMFAVDKGNEPFIPCQMTVENFGSFTIDPSGSGSIDWQAFTN